MGGNYSTVVRECLDEGKRELAAAFYIAIVCYPFDQKQTDAFLLAMRAYCAKQLRDHDEVYVDDEARKLKPEKMRARLEKTGKILFDKRLNIAVNVAIPYLIQSNWPTKAKLPNGLKISFAGAESLAAAERIVALKKNPHKMNIDHDAKNMHKLVYRPTLPVLHLSCAMANKVDWKNMGPINMRKLVLNPEWVSPSLRHAEMLLQGFVSAKMIPADTDIVKLVA